jgi:Domain of unknown function (DUF4349)/Putative zinc-finger
MRTNLHPVAHEEVMAYLDGELTSDRAAEVSAHLVGCLECQAVASDLRGLSDRLCEWTVEAPEILPPHGKVRKEAPSRKWPKLLWPAVALAGAALLAVLIVPRPQRVQLMATRRSALFDRAVAGEHGPLIARSSSLVLRPHDFDHVREAIDQILLNHRGYIAQMTVNAPQGAARSMEGTLRVPSGDLDATLASLGKLGAVLSENRTGEEVTKESMDLDARLNNARNTEQRLTALLKDRTGKLSDVLAVEEKIDAVRLEIERLEVERKALDTRVDFATIDLHVSEEYKAQLEGVRVPVLTRLRKAAVDGISAVSSSLILATSFLLWAGPICIIWVAILFLPVRFAWRRLRNVL